MTVQTVTAWLYWSEMTSHQWLFNASCSLQACRSIHWVTKHHPCIQCICWSSFHVLKFDAVTDRDSHTVTGRVPAQTCSDSKVEDEKPCCSCCPTLVQIRAFDVFKTGTHDVSQGRCTSSLSCKLTQSVTGYNQALPRRVKQIEQWISSAQTDRADTKLVVNKEDLCPIMAWLQSQRVECALRRQHSPTQAIRRHTRRVHTGIR